MLVELVQTTTSDGVRLDGTLVAPPPGTKNAISFDAVLCLHGAGSHFYGSAVFPPLVQPLLELGLHVLRVNTRGHDIVSTAATPRGPRRLGGAFEIVDECRHDVAGWLDFLATRGLARVVLMGHSLGAVKAIYALVNEPRERAALVAISPPRLSYKFFRESPRGSEFFAAYKTAEEHMAAGRGETLMNVTFPLPYLITATGYIDKYGPTERYNFVPLLPRLSCPTLFTFGEQEVESNAAFVGLPDAVQSAASGASTAVATIAAANHFYTGVEPKLADQITTWLAALR